MAILALLVLNHFGRPFEFFFTGYKIPFVISILGVFVALATRGLKALNSAPGRPLVALVCWMLACTAVSTWRGGSANYVLYFVGLEVVLFMLAASAPRSLADIRTVGYVVLGSYLLYMVIGEVSRSTARFDLKGTFGNADDVALLAGFTLPFLVLGALQFRNPAVKMLVLVVGGGVLVRAIGMTGTRAALPAMLGMLAVYFLRGNSIQRVALTAITLIAGLLMIILLPDAISRASPRSSNHSTVKP